MPPKLGVEGSGVRFRAEGSLGFRVQGLFLAKMALLPRGLSFRALRVYFGLRVKRPAHLSSLMKAAMGGSLCIAAPWPLLLPTAWDGSPFS